MRFWAMFAVPTPVYIWNGGEKTADVLETTTADWNLRAFFLHKQVLIRLVCVLTPSLGTDILFSFSEYKSISFWQYSSLLWCLLGSSEAPTLAIKI